MEPTPNLPLPYEPGTASMPPLPFNYVAPVQQDIQTSDYAPEGDIERLVGGHVYCETYEERDLIPAIYRREGITVAYVKQASAFDEGQYPGDSFWYLREGIDNACWTPGPGGGGAATPGILRGGNADPMNFTPSTRWLLA